LMIEIGGAIGPATARYVKEALTTAGERRAGVVILRLNTPGGLATSMRGQNTTPSAYGRRRYLSFGPSGCLHCFFCSAENPKGKLGSSPKLLRPPDFWRLRMIMPAAAAGRATRNERGRQLRRR